MKKLALLLLIIFSSCVARKDTSVYKEDIKKDSIREVREVTKIDRVVDTLFIENPCDSLGNLKPFKYNLITPQGKVTLSDFKGSISGKIDLKGYEKVLETKYKLLYDKKVSEIKKATVIYKTPLWMWVVIILEGLVIFLLFRIR
jgi:hypothetical protein